jgi:hypothetical protein
MNIEGYVTAFSVGDGCLGFRKKTSRLPIFKATVTSEHRDYSDWRAGILRSIVTVQTYDRVPKNRPNSKPLIRTQTAQHPLFGDLREHLYDADGKRILTDYALSFVGWEFLAILYQDDGHILVDKRYNSGRFPVLLCTNSYSQSDNCRLAKAIHKSTGLPFDVRHQRQRSGNLQWRLYLQAKYYHDFRAGVEQFIFPSFGYKLK